MSGRGGHPDETDANERHPMKRLLLFLVVAVCFVLAAGVLAAHGATGRPGDGDSAEVTIVNAWPSKWEGSPY